MAYFLRIRSGKFSSEGRCRMAEEELYYYLLSDRNVIAKGDGKLNFWIWNKGKWHYDYSLKIADQINGLTAESDLICRLEELSESDAMRFIGRE